MEIIKPKLSSKSERIVSDLRKHGHKIEFYLDENIQGIACACPEEKRIYFKNTKLLNDEGTVLHELLHMQSHLIEKYPVMVSTSGEQERAVITLNDIFQHIIIEPRLKKLGFNLREQETQGINLTIDNVESLTDKYKIDDPDSDIETLLTIFYVRAVLMTVDETRMAKLEKFMRGKEWYKDDVVTFLLRSLPDKKDSKEKYEKCLNKCVEKLCLRGDVKFHTF